MKVNKCDKNNTYYIKKEISNASFNSDGAVYIISFERKYYNKYEFLTKKSRGVIINPDFGMPYTDNRFVNYAVKNNTSFARALNDIYHHIINNSKNGIMSYVFLDVETDFLIDDFLKVSNKYNCSVLIAA